MVQLSHEVIRASVEDASLQLIELTLRKLAEYLGVDRLTLWELSADGNVVFRRYTHAASGFEAAPSIVPAQEFGWLMDQNRAGRTVVWERIPDDIPQHAERERDYARRNKVKSLLSIPVSAGSCLCVLTFASLSRPRRWPPQLLERLQLLAAIVAAAIARQRAETSLRASEARNRAIVTVLPDLLLVLSPSGVYTDCHCRDESDLLASPAEFLGRTLEDVMPEEVAVKFRTSIAQAMLGEAVEFEYQLPVRGETRQYEARMVRRDVSSVVCIVRNISQRSRALRQLRESEERFRGLFEHSAIGLAIVGLDGEWIRANAAACAILGYSESELRSLDFQTITHPDDLGANLSKYHEALQGRIEHYQLEKRYLHKEGRFIPVFLSVSIVRNEHKTPLYFVSQLVDLSAVKNAALENDRLRHELAHSDRLALAGQLTASLAHELLQPITAMQMNAQACQHLVAEGAAVMPDIQGGLQDIVASASRAADVIDNVRRLLRREPGDRQPVALNRLVEQIIEVTRHDIMTRKIRLASHLDPSLPEIIGNPIELQQVLLNLLLNGMEALQNVASRREITVESARVDRVVRLSVQDSGRGVEASVLTRIFDPFYTTKPQGLGMGLTISAEIVRAHGGKIWAEPNSRGGMTVHCAFPFEA